MLNRQLVTLILLLLLIVSTLAVEFQFKTQLTHLTHNIPHQASPHRATTLEHHTRHSLTTFSTQRQKSLEQALRLPTQTVSTFTLTQQSQSLQHPTHDHTLRVDTLSIFNKLKMYDSYVKEKVRHDLDQAQLEYAHLAAQRVHLQSLTPTTTTFSTKMNVDTFKYQPYRSFKEFATLSLDQTKHSLMQHNQKYTTDTIFPPSFPFVTFNTLDDDTLNGENNNDQDSTDILHPRHSGSPLHPENGYQPSFILDHFGDSGVAQLPPLAVSFSSSPLPSQDQPDAQPSFTIADGESVPIVYDTLSTLLSTKLGRDNHDIIYTLDLQRHDNIFSPHYFTLQHDNHDIKKTLSTHRDLLTPEMYHHYQGFLTIDVYEKTSQNGDGLSNNHNNEKKSVIDTHIFNIAASVTPDGSLTGQAIDDNEMFEFLASPIKIHQKPKFATMNTDESENIVSDKCVEGNSNVCGVFKMTSESINDLLSLDQKWQISLKSQPKQPPHSHDDHHHDHHHHHHTVPNQHVANPLNTPHKLHTLKTFQIANTSTPIQTLPLVEDGSETSSIINDTIIYSCGVGSLPPELNALYSGVSSSSPSTNHVQIALDAYYADTSLTNLIAASAPAIPTPSAIENSHIAATIKAAADPLSTIFPDSLSNPSFSQIQPSMVAADIGTLPSANDASSYNFSITSGLIELAICNDYWRVQSIPSSDLYNSPARLVNIADSLYNRGAFYPPLRMTVGAILNPMTSLTDPMDMDLSDINGEAQISDASQYLDQFLSWAAQKLSDVDSKVLLSGLKVKGTVVGLAVVGRMCTSQSAGMVQAVYGDGEAFIGTTLAHEVGHMAGFLHDRDNKIVTDRATNKEITCPDEDSRIMGAIASRPPATIWSGCSHAYYHNWLISSSFATCLASRNTKYSGSVCGDGIVGIGETCDCGTLDQSRCADPCCNAATCQLKSGSQYECSNSSPCCKDCKIITDTNMMCRQAVNSQCDTAEYCDGSSALCPLNKVKAAGTSCSVQGTVVKIDNVSSDGISTTKTNETKSFAGLCFRGGCYSQQYDCARYAAVPCPYQDSRSSCINAKCLTFDKIFNTNLTESSCFDPYQVDALRAKNPELSVEQIFAIVASGKLPDGTPISGSITTNSSIATTPDGIPCANLVGQCISQKCIATTARDRNTQSAFALGIPVVAFVMIIVAAVIMVIITVLCCCWKAHRAKALQRRRAYETLLANPTLPDTGPSPAPAQLHSNLPPVPFSEDDIIANHERSQQPLRRSRNLPKHKSHKEFNLDGDETDAADNVQNNLSAQQEEQGQGQRPRPRRKKKRRPTPP